MKEKEKDAQERRDFLRKVGIGGAAALVGSTVMGPASASGHEKEPSNDKSTAAPAVPFTTKTHYLNSTGAPPEASNKFIIELQDWTLDDSGVTAVGNALVAAAIDQVKRFGKVTPGNLRAAMQGFGQFGQQSFTQFGQSFSQHAELDQLNSQ